MDGAIITTYRCNAKCHMCHTWKYPSKRDEEIGLELIKKLPGNLDHLNITGGEPMLRNDIEDIVDVVSSKARCIEVSTNGYFTDRIVRLAEKFPFLKIRVSVEGLPALNDILRGPKNGFDHALRTILELKRCNIKDIGFSFVVSDKNIPDLLNLYYLCASMGIEFTNAPMHNSFYFHKHDNKLDDVDNTVRELKKFIIAMLGSPRSSLRMKVKDWLRAYYNIGIISYISGKQPLLAGCPAGRDMFFLSPFGDILPCNASAEPWIMGNLKEKSFHEIWNSLQAIEIRKKIEICNRNCWMMGCARGKMRRNPLPIINWILINKYRLAFKIPPTFL